MKIVRRDDLLKKYREIWSEDNLRRCFVVVLGIFTPVCTLNALVQLCSSAQLSAGLMSAFSTSCCFAVTVVAVSFSFRQSRF